MKSKKYKILVLSNLKDSTETILKSTVSLSKIVDSEIHLFCVKKPTDLVKNENQLSAIKTINSELIDIDKKIQSLTKPFLDQYNVNLDYSFAFGNVKHEIATAIKDYKPDIIVLGKRKAKKVRLFGDSITQFVIKKHDGAILIAAEENAIEPNKHISLGLLNGLEETFNVEFADELLQHIQKPMKSFKVVKANKDVKREKIPRSENTIEYVFEHRDDAIKNLSNYLAKSKVNLLCIDRNQDQINRESDHIIADFNKVINEFNVSILLTSEQKLTIPYISKQ